MKRMTIGAVAIKSGIKITTIRFYERAGLMPVPTRTAGRHRSYTNNHVLRLQFICKARDLGFSIKEIRTLLDLAEQGQTSYRAVQHLAAVHLEKLRRKINNLIKLEAVLADAVGRCSGKQNTSCPVLDLLQAVD
jgi:MerR family mercuric resistance operon transcriptional regulator